MTAPADNIQNPAAVDLADDRPAMGATVGGGAHSGSLRRVTPLAVGRLLRFIRDGGGDPVKGIRPRRCTYLPGGDHETVG